ncbi:ribonuclease P protein subunit p14-like isoform X2 [Hyperolius riggenbachi]|uniref:ribonuclease P protein subunit p14-like isoform X2 n=1 Tax=Hyperolius riggenbachi TaxID=752182 RepID=UPI0035A28B92
MQGRPAPSAPISYERIVLKNASDYHYMKIQLVFQRKDITLTAVQCKTLFLSALKELHGEVGASFPLDVLKYEEDTLSAILRIHSSGFVKLWTSLVLVGQYQNHECCIRVIQVSPFLLALSCNSRQISLE